LNRQFDINVIDMVSVATDESWKPITDISNRVYAFSEDIEIHNNSF
jgi:hypothetical protein